LARSSFEPQRVSVAELCRQALVGRDPACCTLELAADAPALRCDARLLGAALSALLDNALAAKASRAGLRFVTGPGSGFCVWDDGPGLALPPLEAQRWGVSTRAGACGLGLVVAQRAARAHGFWLELRRERELTEAWILLGNAAFEAAAGGAP
jgi:signal transduction histidine kinase